MHRLSTRQEGRGRAHTQACAAISSSICAWPFSACQMAERLVVAGRLVAGVVPTTATWIFCALYSLEMVNPMVSHAPLR